MSSAMYRLVTFHPEASKSTAMVVAAVLRDNDRVHVVPLESLPSMSCVGGVQGASLLRMVLAGLESMRTFDALPLSTGPHVRLTQAFHVPVGVTDAAKWVQMTQFPQRPSAEAKGQAAPRRAHFGAQFFRQHHLDRWVESNYSPMRLNVSRSSVKPITHYVNGSDTLLLLEPLVTSRRSWKDDVQEVSQKFLAWSTLLADRTADAGKPRFLAYIFGAGEKKLDEAREILDPSRAEVIPLSEHESRVRFVREVDQIGRSSSALH